MRRIALGGLVVFLGLVALEHALRPDLPPGEHFVSEYARGWTWPVQTVAFLAWAAATVACAGLAARVPERRIARAVVVVMLALAAVGLLMAATWRTETVAGELPADVQRTLGGRLHDLGTLGILAGLLVAALASLRLIPGWRYRLTVLALGVVLVGIVPALLALRLDAPGVGQRGFILVGLAWQWAFTAAASVRTAASTAGSRS
jgi:hypothetical protein